MEDKTTLDTDWLSHGACRGQTTVDFYAEHTSMIGRMEQKRAVSVCQNCKVMIQCRDYSLRYERFGVWGGLTELQRHRERKRLNIITELDRFNNHTIMPRTNRMPNTGVKHEPARA